MSAVVTFSGLDRLGELKGRWERLLALTPEPSFLQAFEAFRAAAEAGRGEPRVYMATLAGKAIGLWPMLLTTDRRPWGRVRTLRGGPGGPLGPYPAATAAAVARHLRTATDWDAAVVTEPVDESGAARSTAAFAAAGLRKTEEPAHPLGEVPLGGRWTEVTAGCDDRTRFAVYRTLHDAGEDYSFERRRPASGSSASDVLGDADRLASSLPPEERLVLFATFAEACRQGTADVALLRREGRLIAGALSDVTSAGLENRLTWVAADAPPLAGVRFVTALFRDSLLRGDRRFRFVATPGHLAAGWAPVRHPRVTVRVDAPGRPAAGLHRIERRLRRAFARKPAGFAEA